MSAIKKTKARKNATSKQKAKIIQLKLMPLQKDDQLEQYINGIWKVTHAALWNHKDFSLKEQTQFKELIAGHFKNGINQKRNFKDLVERICLAKRYVNRRRGRYIAKPIDWLNCHYHNGLAGTAKWLAEVNEQRKEVPHYNEGIANLANGILKFMESPNIMVYNRYRTMLIENNQGDLLQIFNNTIINLQYSI